MEDERDAGSPGRPLARRVLRGASPVLWGLLAVVVVGLVLGVMFSRSDPQRAAAMLLGDQVRVEPVGEVTTAPAPSSGDAASGPTCGMVAGRVDAQQQVDALAAGLVVVQFRDPADADAVNEALADRPTEVLVAPNDGLDARVVATAWGRRLRLDAVEAPLLQAFVTAQAGLGPKVTECRP